MSRARFGPTVLPRGPKANSAVLPYLAGLVHDLGKYALLRLASDSSEDVAALSDSSHTLAGKWLSEHWGLPDYLTDVVWLHHHSVMTLSALRKAHTGLIAMVCLANALSKGPGAGVPLELTNHFRLTPSDLEALRAQAEDRLAQWKSARSGGVEGPQPADALRSRTNLLERLVALERQNRHLRALDELHTKLRPGLSLDEALVAVVDSVRGSASGCAGALLHSGFTGTMGSRKVLAFASTTSHVI